MSDYWIGDWIRIISSGKTGKYEGKINGKAKIKTGNKLLLIPLSDIKLIEEDEILNSSPQNKRQNKPVLTKFKSFSCILDLHIEKLNPGMKNEPAQMIINHQIKIAKEYIEEAIIRKKLSVTIIYGKGTGTLKSEIHHLLNSFPQVYFTKSVNDGGAVEIMFSYT